MKGYSELFKKIGFVLAIGLLCQIGFAQRTVLSGQYLQNLPAFSAALTGAGDYVHLQSGFRKQWAGFKDSPNTIFVSAYCPIINNKKGDKAVKNKLMHIKNYSGGKAHIPLSKMGIGGYVSQYNQGPLKEMEAMFNFAVHVPVSKTNYLSFGTSAGLSNTHIDFSDITVEDALNDPKYQSFVQNGAANTILNINGSIAFHSERHYISYSMLQVTRTQLSGNFELNEDKGIRHHFLGGYKFSVGDNWEVFPNALVRITSTQRVFIESGFRARYMHNVWLGGSYRNDRSFVGLIGMILNDNLDFCYAYAVNGGQSSNINNGSHEVTLGIRLFNIGTFASFW
jgi:type IX secretion system PorP/SprF family membrane protein